MKYKIYILVLIFILVESVLCRDLHNEARSHRRNSRRIDGRNKMDKSRDESILSDRKSVEQGSQAISNVSIDQDETKIQNDEAVKEQITPHQLKDEATLQSEIQSTPDSDKKDKSDYQQRNGNKRKRLIEVRKTKVNTNEADSKTNYSEGDKNSYISSKREQAIPDWAIPKKRQQSKPEFRIIDMENYVYSNRGEFHYSYESADGTKAYERGQLRNLNDNSKGTAVFGGYSYKGKDGENYNLQYTADENGYRPVGDHLPTPPPIPPAIARALFYLATKSPPPLPSTEEPIKYDYDYY